MPKKKTHEDFVNQVYSLVGNDYSALTQYKGAHEKVEMKHNECKHSWFVSANSFIKGSRCPKCANKIRGNLLRKTHRDFILEIHTIVGGSYEVLERYTDNRTKLKIKHITCGNIYKVTPSDFLQGKRCPKCSAKVVGNKLRKTHEKFIAEVFDLVEDEYRVLGDYETTHKKIEMKHEKCGNIYSVHPSSFLSGRRCPECYGNKRMTTEIFKSDAYEKVKDEYVVLSEYKNVDTHIEMRHVVCGYKYEVTPYSFLTHGSRCPMCNKGMRKTTEIFKKEVYNLENDRYVVSSEYLNDRTHVTMEHKECGHAYEVIPSNFLRGKRCPKCKESKGEAKIAKWLDRKLIKYVPQYKINDCKNQLPLPFDFAVFNEQDNLLYLIEFDGGQHFKPVKHFGGEEGFIKTKFRDNIKNTYCQENSIPLLRIPYWEYDNIEEILSSEII